MIKISNQFIVYTDNSHDEVNDENIKLTKEIYKNIDYDYSNYSYSNIKFLIEYILGKDFQNKIDNDVQYIIIQEVVKKYSKSKKDKKKKILKVNGTHLYFYSKISSLFTLSKNDKKKIDKYKSTKPFLFKFQFNQICLFFIVDLKNFLIFYYFNEKFFSQISNSKLMDRLHEFLNKNIKYQSFNGKIIPMFIEKFELYESSVLFVNYDLTSFNLISQLSYNNNNIYVTSSPMLHLKENYAMFKRVEFLLTNGKINLNCNTVTFINNHKDHILKTIEILRILTDNKIDLDSVFNLKDSLQNQIDKFSFIVNRDLSRLTLEEELNVVNHNIRIKRNRNIKGEKRINTNKKIKGENKRIKTNKTNRNIKFNNGKVVSTSLIKYDNDVIFNKNNNNDNSVDNK